MTEEEKKDFMVSLQALADEILGYINEYKIGFISPDPNSIRVFPFEGDISRALDLEIMGDPQWGRIQWLRAGMCMTEWLVNPKNGEIFRLMSSELHREANMIRSHKGLRERVRKVMRDI